MAAAQLRASWLDMMEGPGGGLVTVTGSVTRSCGLGRTVLQQVVSFSTTGVPGLGGKFEWLETSAVSTEII